jgi:hypothetical protein
VAVAYFEVVSLQSNWTPTCLKWELLQGRPLAEEGCLLWLDDKTTLPC